MIVSFSLDSLLGAIVVIVVMLMVMYWGDIRKLITRRLNSRKVDSKDSYDRY